MVLKSSHLNASFEINFCPLFKKPQFLSARNLNFEIFLSKFLFSGSSDHEIHPRVRFYILLFTHLTLLPQGMKETKWPMPLKYIFLKQDGPGGYVHFALYRLKHGRLHTQEAHRKKFGQYTVLLLLVRE